MSKKPIAYVIEDNPDLAMIFAQALNGANYQTTAIHDGREAMTKIFAEPPYLVLLDLHLPSFSGQDILQNIRNDASLSEMRVFVASADTRLADTLKGPHTIILDKPVSFIQLQQLARRFHPEQQ